MDKEDTFEYVNERINKIAEQVDEIDHAYRHELTGINIRLRSLEEWADQMSKYSENLEKSIP